MYTVTAFGCESRYRAQLSHQAVATPNVYWKDGSWLEGFGHWEASVRRLHVWVSSCWDISKCSVVGYGTAMVECYTTLCRDHSFYAGVESVSKKKILLSNGIITLARLRTLQAPCIATSPKSALFLAIACFTADADCFVNYSSLFSRQNILRNSIAAVF